MVDAYWIIDNSMEEDKDRRYQSENSSVFFEGILLYILTNEAYIMIVVSGEPVLR